MEKLRDKYVSDEGIEKRTAEKFINEAIAETDKIVSHYNCVLEWRMS